MVISENFHQLVPIFGTAERVCDIQSVEAAAVCGSFTCEVKDLGSVFCSRV